MWQSAMRTMRSMIAARTKAVAVSPVMARDVSMAARSSAAIDTFRMRGRSDMGHYWAVIIERAIRRVAMTLPFAKVGTAAKRLTLGGVVTAVGDRVAVPYGVGGFAFRTDGHGGGSGGGGGLDRFVQRLLFGGFQAQVPVVLVAGLVGVHRGPGGGGVGPLLLEPEAVGRRHGCGGDRVELCVERGSASR